MKYNEDKIIKEMIILRVLMVNIIVQDLLRYVKV